MNILLVEDTESIIKGLTYSLEKEGYNLIVKKRGNNMAKVKDLRSALELLRKCPAGAKSTGHDLIRALSRLLIHQILPVIRKVEGIKVFLLKNPRQP